MNCVCYLSEMGIRTGAIKSLGRTLLMMQYGNIDLGQNWLRWWLDVWLHQVLTATNMTFQQTLSKVFCSLHLNAVSQEVGAHKRNLLNVFINYAFKISTTSPWGQWVYLLRPSDAYMHQ